VTAKIWTLLSKDNYFASAGNRTRYSKHSPQTIIFLGEMRKST